MADINIKEKLDIIDQIQVVVYRLGIMLCGLALLMPAFSNISPKLMMYFQAILITGSVFIAASLHVYSKLVRFILSHSTWIALIMFALNHLLQFEMHEGWVNGLLLITLSGVAYKESYCFRIPGLKLTPIILFVATIAQIINLQPLFIGACSTAALLTIFMSVAKWRMPLHFDIGDKSKYQL